LSHVISLIESYFSASVTRHAANAVRACPYLSDKGVGINVARGNAGGAGALARVRIPNVLSL